MNKVLIVGLCVGLLGCGVPTERAPASPAQGEVYIDTPEVSAKVLIHDRINGGVLRIVDKERGNVCYIYSHAISCLPDYEAQLTAEDKHWRTLDQNETTALLDQIQ